MRGKTAEGGEKNRSERQKRRSERPDKKKESG